MRGYFGVGVENISKEQNVGALARTAHAFGASFFYTVNPAVDVRAMRQTDTSGAFDHLPYYQYEGVSDFALPRGCTLVGVELTEDSIELPSFRHPVCAAYMMGPEMGSLSDSVQERCDFIVKIPTKFCVNVGLAGALVMYDRMISMGRFADRPVAAGGPLEDFVKVGQKSHRRKIRKPKS